MQIDLNMYQAGTYLGKNQHYNINTNIPSFIIIRPEVLCVPAHILITICIHLPILSQHKQLLSYYQSPLRSNRYNTVFLCLYCLSTSSGCLIISALQDLTDITLYSFLCLNILVAISQSCNRNRHFQLQHTMLYCIVDSSNMSHNELTGTIFCFQLSCQMRLPVISQSIDHVPSSGRKLES